MAGTKICLSSDVVFDFLTGDENTKQKIKMYSTEDMCITSLTLFELRCAVEKQDVVSEFLNYVSVMDLDTSASEAAARIIKEDLRHGNTRSTKSTLNAAMCIANNVLLFTKDRASFDGIRGLKLV
ncbi:MAG: type II toxin-antitoxin system VapC family toxin [Candidatus Micrarchaeia archaeon]